jgi:hypothetical protein
MPEDHRKMGWLASRRERKRLKRERTGNSPEKQAEHHMPKRDAIDMWLKSGGVDRESRFKK